MVEEAEDRYPKQESTVKLTANVVKEMLKH